MSLHSKKYKLIAVMGFTQILAWSSTFYLPAVLANLIAKDTGWSLTLVIAGLSWGFIVTGICSPKVGRFIEQFGGRKALSIGSIFFAVGLICLGLSTHLLIYYFAWTMLGIGMAFGLYDAAFSTLCRLLGKDAKTAIVGVTLLGGLASTIGWALIVFLEGLYGWRISCFILALFHLLLGLPLHYFLLPREEQSTEAHAKELNSQTTVHKEGNRLFMLVAVILTVQSFVVATVSVHLLSMLKTTGFSVSTALAIGMMIGPAQIIARLLEFSLFKNLHPSWSSRLGGLISFFGLFFLFVDGYVLALLGAALYGAGNGILTIIRGTLPLALFGQEGYATRMGLLGRPIMIALAFGPLISAFILEKWGINILLIILTALVFIALLGTLKLPVHQAEKVAE
ncbi:MULTISPECIES: MFS transporter [Acinetobacter]|uniref:MFS transporter n=2 Tax=Moraxellaceae TaxID=468 RepID=UPI00062AB5DE|nr:MULTISPECIES: MFS transporter [Acinetobacter]MBC70311.1 MFS transporter [Acinetobacter sp.]MBT51148.1 MFS transporter [Acinetobacter sp.]TGU86554.1 MFS transporter [Acinetobacter pittii]HJP46980.1 MFS transporter [Acinetobacter venetianus]